MVGSLEKILSLPIGPFQKAALPLLRVRRFVKDQSWFRRRETALGIERDQFTHAAEQNIDAGPARHAFSADHRHQFGPVEDSQLDVKTEPLGECIRDALAEGGNTDGGPEHDFTLLSRLRSDLIQSCLRS